MFQALFLPYCPDNNGMNSPAGFTTGSRSVLQREKQKTMQQLSNPVTWYTLLKFIHVTSFAIWFGTVFASVFLLKTLEPALTGKEADVARYPEFLKTYIKQETAVADTGFKTAVVSGLLLAFFFHGWTLWVSVKAGLIVLQVALTMRYIIKSIQPLRYPCPRQAYINWYKLFGISLTMFAMVLSVTFFFL